MKKISDRRPCFQLFVMPVTRLTVRAQSGAADAQTTKVKAEVAKRVANKKTKVKVKLRSGEQLKGQIDQSDDSGFTITQDQTNSQEKISYADVENKRTRRLKYCGENRHSRRNRSRRPGDRCDRRIPEL